MISNNDDIVARAEYLYEETRRPLFKQAIQDRVIGVDDDTSLIDALALAVEVNRQTYKQHNSLWCHTLAEVVYSEDEMRAVKEVPPFDVGLNVELILTTVLNLANAVPGH